MRRLAIVAAIVVPIVAALVLIETPAERDASDGERSGLRPDRRVVSKGPIDLTEALAEDFFNEDRSETEIDGETVVWPRSLLFVHRLEPDGEDRYILTEPVLVLNRTPRTREELAALASVDSTEPPAAIRVRMEELATRHLSLRAASAELLGADLTDARTIFFRHSVRGFLPPSRDDEAPAGIEAEDLRIERNGGRFTRFTTVGPTTVRRGEQELSGRGVAADLDAGTFRIASAVSLRVPPSGDGPGEPTTIRGGGPLDLLRTGASAAEGRRGGLSLRDAVVMIRGGVTVKRAGFTATGQSLEARFDARGRIISLLLTGDASVDLPEATVGADRIAFASKGDGSEEIVLEEGHRRILFRGMAGRLPLGGAETDDLMLTAEGPVSVVMAPGAGPARRLIAEQTVILRGVPPEGAAPRDPGSDEGVTIRCERLEAATLRLEVVRADRTTPDAAETLANLRLSGGVTGTGPDMTFAAAALDLDRRFTDAGVPEVDVVVLTGSPRATLRRAARRAAPPAAAESQRTSLLGDTSTIEIIAERRIAAFLPAFQDGDLVLCAEGRSRLAARGPDGSDGSDGGHVAGDRIEVTLAPEPGSLLDERRRRRFSRLAADGGAGFALGERLRGSGHALVLDAVSGEVALSGSGLGGLPGLLFLPRLELGSVAGVRGSTGWLIAASITYREATSTLVTAGATWGRLDAPPPGDGSAGNSTEPTWLYGRDLEVALAGAGAPTAGAAVTALSTEAEFIAAVAGDEVRGRRFRIDAATKTAIVEGDPLDVRLHRVVGGVAVTDQLFARRASRTANGLLIEGRVTGRLHMARSPVPFMERRSAGAAAPAAPAGPLRQIDIATDGNVLFAADTITFDGSVDVSEPRSGGGRGFRLTAAGLKLVCRGAEPEAWRSLDVAGGVATGGVVLDSERLSCRADTMVFEVDSGRIQCRGVSRPAEVTFEGVRTAGRELVFDTKTERFTAIQGKTTIQGR